MTRRTGDSSRHRRSPATCLRALLRSSGERADAEWRTWADRQLRYAQLGPDELSALWQVILEFDPLLSAYARQPLDLGERAVVVAGSGKETFKTFNVSTAASVLAAAAGARIVKGVSSSVSAVSGSADVLCALRAPICRAPRNIPWMLERDGIVFVPYAAFCPRYAARYDGVFTTLTPFSFFMPAAVLAVRAQSFVYGIAHRDVARAARAIHAVRPDYTRGTVIGTSFAGGRIMDEVAPFAYVHTAELHDSRIISRVRQRPAPTATWSAAVGHRASHHDNANRMIAALQPEPETGSDLSAAELVEHNAALILSAYHDHAISDWEARHKVRRARKNGHAAQLLADLCATAEQMRDAS